MFKHSPQLKKIYDTYNRKFFNNQLPRDTQIGYNDEIEGKHGLTLGIEDEETHHRFFIIYISPTTHTDMGQKRLTILHEMCHVRLHPLTNHGREFQEEMKRLAMRDAFKEIW